MARRRPLFLMLVAGIALAVGYLIARPFTQQATGTDVPRPPAKAPVVVCLGHVDVEGGVTAISPPQSGRVIAVNVAENGSVIADAVLLNLDDRQARFAAAQARAAVESAKLRLNVAEQDMRQQPMRIAQLQAASESAEHKLATARHLLERQQELLKINNTNIQDVRAAESQVKEQEALVRASWEKLVEAQRTDANLPVREARAALVAAEAQAHSADYAVEQCEVRAPSAGTVLRVQTSAGEIIGGAGSPAAILFSPDKPFVVRAEVEQEFVRRLEVGQKAKVEDESGGGTAWTGKVARIAGWYSSRRGFNDKPSAFKDVPTVECLIQLDERRPALRIGQRVQVTIGE
jgi:multidrug resistance efflux pump